MAWSRLLFSAKLSLSGVTALSVAGGAALYTQRNRYLPYLPLYPSPSDWIPQIHPPLSPLLKASATTALSSPLVQPVARDMNFVRDVSELNLRLFQYQTCPFCCKVRAYLDYHGISYKVVEVNSVFRTQVKEWSVYHKVPIVVVSSHEKTEEAQPEPTWFQVNDSSVIMSAIESYLMQKKKEKLDTLVSFYPSFDTTDKHTGKPKVDYHNKYNIMHGKAISDAATEKLKREIKWRRWVDNVFVHFLAPNIYRTPREALDAFHYVSESGEWEKHFPDWERLVVIYLGAAVMYIISKRLKKRYSLDPDVRQSLYAGCAKWVAALEGKDYLGGDEPNLADISMYGVLNSIEGCSAFVEAMHHNPAMFSWYSKMKLACAQNAGTCKQTQ